MTGAKSDLSTTVAIAIAAYALCDLAHEVAGHGLAALLTPGIRIVSLSSVALQTSGESRIVAAAGSIANVLIGAAALAAFHRLGRLSPGAYFLWLFGTINLLNGSGYPLYSAVLGSGDWEVVVRALEPAWAWRVALGVAGIAAYAGMVVVSARALARVTSQGIPGLVFPAYVAGGLLLVAASALNPIGPSLILVSGVASGFAAMAGLALVPSIVEARARNVTAAGGALERSPGWIVTGAVIGIAFVAIIGPGIRCESS